MSYLLLLRPKDLVTDLIVPLSFGLPGLQPWDCAAGILLVHEAGGTVGDLTSVTPGRVPASGDVLATAHGLWEPLLRLLRPVYVG